MNKLELLVRINKGKLVMNEVISELKEIGITSLNSSFQDLRDSDNWRDTFFQNLKKSEVEQKCFKNDYPLKDFPELIMDIIKIPELREGDPIILYIKESEFCGS